MEIQNLFSHLEKQVSGHGKIRQILHCGFPVAIVEDIKHSMVPQEDYGDGSYAGNLKFILERPFFLKNPFPAVFFRE